MNIIGFCKQYDEAEAACSVTSHMSSEEQALGDALDEARENLLSFIKERMEGAERAPLDLAFAYDLAYFNTWFNLRGGIKR